MTELTEKDIIVRCAARMMLDLDVRVRFRSGEVKVIRDARVLDHNSRMIEDLLGRIEIRFDMTFELDDVYNAIALMKQQGYQYLFHKIEVRLQRELQDKSGWFPDTDLRLGVSRYWPQIDIMICTMGFKRTRYPVSYRLPNRSGWQNAELIWRRGKVCEMSDDNYIGSLRWKQDWIDHDLTEFNEKELREYVESHLK